MVSAWSDASTPPAATDVDICPQPGPQSLFLSTDADLIIYGGSAGGG